MLRVPGSGTSGATAEHLRVILDDEDCCDLLVTAAHRLAQADVPATVAAGLRLGRMVALLKPRGGVRALVMGDVFRRLVSRTLAQQFSTHLQEACAPYQYESVRPFHTGGYRGACASNPRGHRQ